MDNGDGTITDTQLGLIWEKKDQSGGLHDVNTGFPWAGSCSDTFAPCQADAAATATCNAATGGALGCAQCSGTATCEGGSPTIWTWLNQLNAAGFAGNRDWRIPTIGLDGGAVELETIVDRSVSSGCGTGSQVPSPTSFCVAAPFNAGCASGCTATSCSCTQNQRYLSATTVAADPSFSAWSVSFFTGQVGRNAKIIPAFVRAVRGTPTTIPCGTFLDRFGSQGSGAGQFLDPEDVAVDQNGNIFVADGGNNVIEKFTSGGTFLHQWGSLGSAAGQFNVPDDIAVDAAGNVYVADFLNNRIEKFDNNGTFLTSWGATGIGGGQFKGPAGVAIDAAGNVYVADFNNNRVQKFTSSGGLLTAWGTEGSGDGQFEGPIGVAVDPNQNVYVVDSFNNRVQKFTNIGAFLGEFGSQGRLSGQLNAPTSIAINTAGAVFVVDQGNDRIEVFTGTGFLVEWGSIGSAVGQFNRPIAVAADRDGTVLVTDDTPLVQRFACSPASPAGGAVN